MRASWRLVGAALREVGGAQRCGGGLRGAREEVRVRRRGAVLAEPCSPRRVSRSQWWHASSLHWVSAAAAINPTPEVGAGGV